MPYYSEIEWELLQEDQIFESPIWKFEFPFEVPPIKKLIIKRAENYKVQVKIIFDYDVDFSKEIHNLGIIDSIKISSETFGEEYLLKNTVPLNIVAKNIINSHGTICLYLSPRNIIFNRLFDGDTAWIKEWYLNGPKNESIFPRIIDYNKKKIYEKELKNCPSELELGKKFKIETNQEYTMGRYMFCKLDDKNDILINLVPNKMKPDWSNKVCISYASNDYIQNKKLRNEIEFVISFIFGRKLIKIGEAHYDSNGIKIKENIKNPFLNDIFNIKTVCISNNNFPIPFKAFDSNNEQIISNIINSFISLRNSLDFSTMFINYWNSTFLLPESKIVLLAASLESIKDTWFKSKNSKQKTKILDKNEYDDLIKDIKKEFYNLFRNHKELLYNFNQLNRCSINKSFELFFEEINMEISDIEKKAISYRNKPVHGNDIYSEDYSEMIIYSEVYHVIVNRVILSLLGYDGPYYMNNIIQSKVQKGLFYSFEELKEDIFQIKSYENDEE